MKYFRRLQYVLDFNIASVVVSMFSLFDMRLFYNIMGTKNGFFFKLDSKHIEKSRYLFTVLLYQIAFVLLLQVKSIFPKVLIKHVSIYENVFSRVCYSQCCILPTKAYFTWDSFVTILGQKKESEQNKQRRGENTCIGVFF